MPFKAGHLFKLVPVTIGGTYVTYPSFLPAMPKNIEGLLSERDCFIAQKGSDNNYLLACITKIGKTFDFFFHNPSSSHSIPVKYLKLGSSIDSGGGTNQDKKLNLDFVWGKNSSLSIHSYLFENHSWLKDRVGVSSDSPKDWNMSTFCDKYEITKYKLGGLTPASGHEVSEDSENSESPKNFKYLLNCTWKKENNEEVQEYWRQLESPPLAPPRNK